MTRRADHMNGLPYYKAYPRDFFEGTVGMDGETKGAYRMLLDLIYMHNGYLPNDSKYVAGLMGYMPRKWTQTILRNILATGKIEAITLTTSHGDQEYLTNARANRELELTDAHRGKQSEIAQDREAKKAAKPRPKDEQKKKAPETGGADVTGEAIEIYNSVAAKAQWPAVQKMTEARSKMLQARIRDVGGVEGWTHAVERAAQSDFLCGRTEKPWSGFGFDWLVKQANFTKLMEGNYDNRNSKPGGSHGAGRGPHQGMVAAFAEVARERSGRT